MYVWTNAVLTDQGRALLAKLTQGNTLALTRAVTGTGYSSPDFLASREGVSDPKQVLSFMPVSYPEEGKCAIPVVLTNAGLTSGYVARQIGIFATDPDEGEILLFIVQAPDSNSGTPIPSETEMPGYSAEWTFYLKYGQADNVSVTVDPSNTISFSDLETYFNNNLVRITNAEIDEIVGLYGGDGGDSGTGDGTGGGVATLDHSKLLNRYIADQHTITSITGLADALTAVEGTDLESADIESVWNNA